MAVGLYSGVSGLALGIGLYRNVSGLWGGASGLIDGFGGADPYAGASLYLNFLDPTLDSRITFSRGTNATLIDSTGKLTYAPNNFTLNSQNILAAGTWSVFGGVNRAVDVGTAPDGTVTANRITSANATAFMGVQANTAVLLNTSLVASIYLKAGTQRYVQLIDDAGDAGNDFANFDLQTGIAQTTASGVSPTITAVGDGWYRCSLVVRNLGLSQSGFYILFASSLTAARGAAFAGTGNETILLWGAQQEQVTYQTTPSTYVATTASAYYGPRFDYDPVTLAPRGLLIEEARTNLALRSEEFNDAAWGVSGVAVTANTTVAPSGVTAADTITGNSASGAVIFPSGAGVSASATSYTASCYVKPGSAAWIVLSLWQGSGTSGVNVWFNAQTGAVGSNNATAGYVFTSASSTAVGNGWYRITVTGTVPAAALFWSLRLVDSDNAFVYTNTVGDTLFVWGAQLEAGSFATSYIPTVASTVTRNADVATMTGTNFSSWYNQSEGTFVAEASTPVAQAAAGRILEASTGTAFRVVDLSVVVGPNLQMYNGTTAFNAAGTVALNTPFKAAGAYRTANYGVVLNGGTATTNTDVLVNTANALQIGRFNTSSNYLNGHIRTIAYFNTRLPNAQLQTLTAPSLATTLSLDFTSGSYNVGF